MRKEIIYVTVIIAAIIGLFFNKTFLHGAIPFPGDLLLAEYQPWRSSQYLGYNPGAVPHKAQYPDTLRQTYPWKSRAMDLLKKGILPLWNPYNFSGSPLLANFQSAVFYPLNIFYGLLSPVLAWTFLIVSQPLLAMVFTLLYCRSLRLSILTSLFAAVTFGFSSYMIVWLEYGTIGHVIIWLPLMLWAIECINRKAKWYVFAILALANTSALFAGHPQLFSYLFVMEVIYALLRSPKTLKFTTLITILLGIAIAGIQIIPGIELISSAARSPHEFSNLFDTILIQPWQLLMLVFPNIFGNPATRTWWPMDTYIGKVTSIGIIPLFFLLSAFRRQNFHVRFFGISAVVVLILITANPLTFLLYQIPLPIISTSSPTLMSFLLMFSITIVCAIGMENWITEHHSFGKLIKRFLQVFIVLALLWISLTKIPILPFFHTHEGLIVRSFAYGAILSIATFGLFAIAVKRPKYTKLLLSVLLMLHIGDLYIQFNRFNPFMPTGSVYPGHEILTFLKNHGPDRYWGYGTGRINENIATAIGMYSPEGYDPLYPKWYGAFIHSSRGGTLLQNFTNDTRSDAVIAPGFGENGFESIPRLKILSALSVRYILDRTENGSTAQTFPPWAYRLIYQSEDWRVMENLASAPRVFIASRVFTTATTSEFEQKFFSADFNPSIDVILDSSQYSSVPEISKGTAAIEKYTENEISVETDTDSPAILVLTDTYFPGWSARVDSLPTPIMRANWALRAVRVPQGSHTVTFVYQPLSFTIGLIISMMSMLLLAILLVYVKKRKT